MRETQERRWHNVKANETTKLPRRYVFLDTEARTERIAGGHEQTWRLAAASFVIAEKGRKRQRTLREYVEPKALWRDVEAFIKKGARTVLWAHNLGYDARIAQAFDILPRTGWKLTAHNISKSGTWMEWQKDGATLVMADSIAVFNTTIAKVGEYFGIGKLAVNPSSDDDTQWMRRCVRDVEILETAMMAYLGWLESDDMGNWQITGSGQSWASYRHKFLTHKLVVHDDEAALAAERRAMWSGRCEAYWHGEIRSQVVHEWDFTQAYAQIARANSVPVRLIGPMPDGYDWRRIVDSEQSALLAKCTVTTSVPVVPCQRDGRILWPVGTFTTTLWDVEIRAALDAGAEVTVEQGWLYRLKPALKAWAEWVISQLDAPEDVCPTWRKQILKHWSRALIGRFAMTYNEWEEFAEAPDLKVQRARLYDLDTKEEYEIMQIGHEVWADNGRVESPNSMPMVTGYIQAIARVQLWNVMQELPEGTLLYVDTDSLLCTAQYSPNVERAARKLGYQNLRLKRSWDGFTIRGPRQIITGDQVRVSGVPTMAQRRGGTLFAGEIWTSLPGSLRGGNTSGVRIRDRTWNITGVDNRRRSSGLGWTRPIELTPDGGNGTVETAAT